MSQPEEISIFAFNCYRQYLAAFYEHRKQSVKGFSYRKFSEAAGFKSPNVLKLAIQGKRRISLDSVDKFAKALELKGKKRDYFELLIRADLERSVVKKEHLLHSLDKARPFTERKIDTESHEYLSHWIYPVIREMSRDPDFRPDPYYISKNLVQHVPIDKIRRALAYLFESGFITRVDNRFVCHEQIVSTTDELASLMIRKYNQTLLDQGKVLIENLPIGEREFGALTLTLPAEKLSELKQKLKAFRSELNLWAESNLNSDSQQVVQIAMQMYPQTKCKAKSRV